MKNLSDERSLFQIFSSHSKEILEQQGFLKNENDIVKVCNYLERSFVPRKALSNPNFYKAANKLLCSLKLYAVEVFKHEFESTYKPRFKNVRQNFSFLQKIPEDFDISRYVVCEDLPQMSSTYKEKEILTRVYRTEEMLAEDDIIGRKRLKKRAIEYFKHNKSIKNVDRSTIVNPKLLKKYSNELDLDKDLYKIFLCWVESKRKSGEHMKMVKSNYWLRSPFGQDPGNWNKHHIKYYLEFQDFRTLLNMKHEEMAKRFWRIFKFLKCLKGQKPINLDSVSEKMLSDSQIRNDRNELVPKEDIKVTISKKFVLWYDKIFNDLIKKGFLEKGDKYLMESYGKGNFLTSSFNFYPRGRLVRKLGKVKSVLRKVLIDFVQKTYLETGVIPKEEVKKRIYDSLFVTKMRESIKGYLEYEDAYKLVHNVDNDKFLSMEPKDFEQFMVENYSIPVVFRRNVPDFIDLQDLAIHSLVYYKMYRKHYTKCEDCDSRNTCCFSHGDPSMMLYQYYKENTDFTKKEVKKIVSESHYMYQFVCFDEKRLKKDIKRATIIKNIESARRIEREFHSE